MYFYNFAMYPSTFFDGGYLVHVDAPITTKDYSDPIEQCGARAVPSLGLITTMEWLGDGLCEVRIRIANGMPANTTPADPPAPIGTTYGLVDTSYVFRAGTSDVDGDDLWYQWDWDDGVVSDWEGPIGSGENSLLSHSWSAFDTSEVSVRALDSWGNTTGWSPALTVIIGPPCCVIRGDMDGSSEGPDISDLVYIVDYMFSGGPKPPCEEEGNVDGITGIDISDLVYLVDYMFTGGPEPVPCP